MIRMDCHDYKVDKHLHLDRAWTAFDRYFSGWGLSLNDIYNMPLSGKQDVMGYLHEGLAYKPKELKRRMSSVLRMKSRAGEEEFWAPIDTSPDVGLMPLEIANELKAEFPGLKTGIYPIFGFCSGDSMERYDLIVEACEKKLGNFLVGLPERDARKGHELIAEKWGCQNGFDAHIKVLLELACEYRLPVQIHLDQVNSPDQHDSERVLDALDWLKQPEIPGHVGPTVEFVHMISPACYKKKRLEALIERMVKHNIGLVCCPEAAISMRQLPCHKAPIHNSVAPLLRMRAAGIPVRFGTDNIGDHLVPVENPYLRREIECIANGVRFYLQDIFVDMVNGNPLNNVQMGRIGQYLTENDEVCHRHKVAKRAKAK